MSSNIVSKIVIALLILANLATAVLYFFSSSDHYIKVEGTIYQNDLELPLGIISICLPFVAMISILFCINALKNHFSQVFNFEEIKKEDARKNRILDFIISLVIIISLIYFYMHYIYCFF